MNRYNAEISNRRSIRMKGYDYSKVGMYFITICTQNREYILSTTKCIEPTNVGAESISAHEKTEELSKTMSIFKLTKAGKMVKKIYEDLENEFDNIKICDYIIMPNHIHGIIEICKRAEMDSAPTIPEIIQCFKRKTTIEYIKRKNNENLYKFP